MKVSVIIPAHNEENTVAKVVRVGIDEADEVIVVDSCSSDDTALHAKRVGARVVRTNTLGKHHAIRKGIMAAKGSELVFLDADLVNPEPYIVRDLVAALRTTPKVTISKGYYRRSFNGKDGEGGRLTELCARPLLSLLFPHLSVVRQPLSGEFAVRLADILDMPFAPGFAVDLGILLHCATKGEVAQVDLGSKMHKHRSLTKLGIAGVEVAATILRAAGWKISETILEQYVADLAIRSRINLEQLPSLCMIRSKMAVAKTVYRR